MITVLQIWSQIQAGIVHSCLKKSRAGARDDVTVTKTKLRNKKYYEINPLNTELNPICQ